MANGNDGCMTRKPWEPPFLAEPEEVAALRRVVRLHLRLWGLSDVAEVAEICVSELVSNVIRHVGAGTSSTLVVEMNGTRLRVALRDRETRALPTLLSGGHIDDPRVAKSGACPTLYAGGRGGEHPGAGRVGIAFQEEPAIDLIADLLHWLRAHGHDPDEALDRAQAHFEAELGAG
ncbi:ATP-binding protein [Streptomyces sp. NPDC059616]|uniref:ATP-binding protein n=1 Tax=Streptomyces sp. NPDC059616 TaxID=3346886 RepID=UPI003681EE6E